MKCPHCHQDALHPQYHFIRPVLYLDAARPCTARRELANLSCKACSMLWYALPGETASAALERIRHEDENINREPHPWELLCRGRFTPPRHEPREIE